MKHCSLLLGLFNKKKKKTVLNSCRGFEPHFSINFTFRTEYQAYQNVIPENAILVIYKRRLIEVKPAQATTSLDFNLF